MLAYKLENKQIFLFSGQAWGTMLLSKHHYAITLAERGNTVYFINPPLNHFQKVRLEDSQFHENLFIVSFGFLGIQKFRFHWSLIFELLNRYNLKRLKKRVCLNPDVIWNFDFNGYCDFSLFESSLKISHPVDFIPEESKKNALGADVMFSVATEILEDLKGFKIPSFFINHGIHEGFFKKEKPLVKKSSRVKVGYVGNLLRIDVNHRLILQLIQQNQEVEFVFMGNYTPSNIGGVNYPEGNAFVEILKQSGNVILTGVLNKEQLSVKMREIDIFLIAYDKERDFCRGTNYHKVMEYLAIGKVIVSNYITTYKEMNLVEMIGQNDNEEELVLIFDRVKNNLSHYNSKELVNKRIGFAKDNLYAKQVDRIELILAQL